MGKTVLILLALLLETGCAVLVGNVEPDERAHNYAIANLANRNPKEWVRLAPDPRANEGEDARVEDLAFQSRKTASIISINSTCRPLYGTEPRNLKQSARLLFLGMSGISLHKQREFNIQHVPALETTVQGTLNGGSAKIRSVVLRRGQCDYDLIYVARPTLFGKNEKDFADFVTSLRLK